MSGSLALASDGRVIASRTLTSEGRRHAQSLVSEASQMLMDVSLGVQDLTGVAVSIGPGSFTGLRVGLVFAKTLAWIQSIPLVAVDTHRAMAQQRSSSREGITILSDAQRNELFVSSYEWPAGSSVCQIVGEIAISKSDDLPVQWPLAGTGLFKHRDSLLARGHRLVEDSIEPIAGTVALVGLDMLKHNQLSVPETLEPLYIRPSYAEEKRAR
ncbi:MAG: tRNA (adenosine(37)-N6)-threonylcarbamoyltransferase complex dimerization subunit type 1 TsaB [Planctomycetaceae bacterium]|nr:tRNA (adenosine(37)-N6)-threonylcarbamoyltransferase complex dimerization subunit type 1 TsaB [Planctomycetaceae bacterium]